MDIPQLPVGGDAKLIVFNICVRQRSGNFSLRRIKSEADNIYSSLGQRYDDLFAVLHFGYLLFQETAVQVESDQIEVP